MSKDSTPFGYFEIELKVTGEPYFSIISDCYYIGHGQICIIDITGSYPDVIV